MQGCKGRLAKISQKNHKNGHNFSCTQHFNAEFLWFWNRVCAIGEFIYDTPVHKGQRGVTMATNFGTKIAINAYKCISTKDSDNVITYNRGFVVDQSKADISDCKGLRGVAMATKFWPK